MATFKIPIISATTNKSIRFPNDLIDAIQEAIRGKNCTFTAFVVAAAWAALEQTKESE